MTKCMDGCGDPMADRVEGASSEYVAIYMLVNIVLEVGSVDYSGHQTGFHLVESVRGARYGRLTRWEHHETTDRNPGDKGQVENAVEKVYLSGLVVPVASI